MRPLPLFISSVIAIALVFILNTQWVAPIPFGKFLSPQHGLWQNADPYDKDYNANLSFPQLKGKASVYFDDRMVPHVFADNDDDAYFIQGYLHAKFRLWQMDFQTRAASGRLSEIIGAKTLDYDRNQRRLGMVYAAERSLKEIEQDPESLAACNSYTAGVNAYIARLTDRTMPLEYKLLGYKPEKWNNLKSALFLKFMALDLAGYENDFESTNAKSVFSNADFNALYPIVMDSLDPIVPKGTHFDPPPKPLEIPATADSLYFNYKDSNSIEEQKPNPDNGSNNWAVAGSKTKSGAPILCNDPHLGLNLPSLWYEMQITTPSFNAYGVTFPGAPSIIIGFNDSIAFGFTNAMRDVRDYFPVKYKDESRKEYWFDSAWHPTSFRIEDIKIKGKPDMYDTVAYTNIGPVMYDESYTGGRNTNGSDYAVRWKAHDPSNELKVFYLLDRAKNYDDYLAAIKYLHTPGQNCIYASKRGDIAIWDQGEFPAKWYRQGDFVMPGGDSSYFWQYNIPQEQNPHLTDPERGFVSSANQMPTDTTYPYYLGGVYPAYRGFEINRRLSQMNNITTEDMMKLQTDNYNVFGEMAVPPLLANIRADELDADGKRFLDTLKNWNFRNDAGSYGTTIFVNLWDTLEHVVFDDEFATTRLKLPWPEESTLLDKILRKDTSFRFFDNINTSQTETFSDDVTAAFKRSVPLFRKLEKQNKLKWALFKDTRVLHLARLDALSRLHLDIGGGTNTINAANGQHGPSWRMVVQLSGETEAYGVYPGGQSGNPGSRYYDDFVDSWVNGKYYKLWVMKPSEALGRNVIYTMHFSPAGA
ncbi:MAG: penicillin acylase family protein [Chitinophagaceae bacterium]|nr:penicillin acylase family protein [Chitinophagaceae bacterium]